MRGQGASAQHPLKPKPRAPPWGIMPKLRLVLLVVAVGRSTGFSRKPTRVFRPAKIPFFLEKRVMGTGLKPLNHFRLKAVIRPGDRSISVGMRGYDGTSVPAGRRDGAW